MSRYAMDVQPRRAQQPITFRSDKAAPKLARLAGTGRSQAQIIEDALDRVAEPPPVPDDDATRWERIREIQAQARRERIPSMAEFDAIEYDADGNCR